MVVVVGDEKSRGETDSLAWAAACVVIVSVCLITRMVHCSHEGGVNQPEVQWFQELIGCLLIVYILYET